MYRIDPPLPFIKPYKTYLGFDPGTTHMGIAVTFRTFIDLYQINMIRDSSPTNRIKNTIRILDILRGSLGMDDPYTSAVIEGASFADQFRQVELAECRTAIFLWLGRMRNVVDHTRIIPPLTIRKGVFGKAQIKAHDYWDNSEIPNDALAALSCLYYADVLEKDTENGMEK